MGFNIPSKCRKDIGSAINLLKNEGCQLIFLFDSLVTGKTHDDSDIDSGIKGPPKDKFFDIYSRLYFDIENRVDLVSVHNVDTLWTDFPENRIFVDWEPKVPWRENVRSVRKATGFVDSDTNSAFRLMFNKIGEVTQSG